MIGFGSCKSVLTRAGKYVFAFVFAVSFLWGVTMQNADVYASEKYDPLKDPMVKICSLPIDKNIDEVLAGISEDVSRETGIGQENVTYYWLTLDNINCMGKKTTDYPILVDLYVPSFLTDEQIAGVMTSLAAALEKHVGIDRKWVFIYTHVQKPGQVYISGEVMMNGD